MAPVEPVKITSDDEAGFTYLRLREGAVARTAPLGESVNIDYDEAGECVGIEFLMPREQAIEAMKKALDLYS